MLLTTLSLVLGCAHRPPPVVFPVAAPVTAPLPELDVQAEPGDCAQVASFRPGDEPACAGLLVPRVRYAEFLAAEDGVEYLQSQVGRCEAGRAWDREHGQAVHNACWHGWQESEARNRTLQIWVPVVLGGTTASALVVGFLLGSALN